MMVYEKNIIFVELKNTKGRSNKDWIVDGEKQLKSTIKHFKKNHTFESYDRKIAYISNKRKPEFRETQITRMAKFKENTEVVLRIEAKISLS